MKVILITGSSTGIGQATALHLARQGHHVFASMRNPTTSSAVLQRAAHEEGLALDVIQLDVNDQTSADRAVNCVLERTGRIDVLINNAGIGGGGTVEETPEEVLKAVFETNFFGAMRMMRLVLPTMRQVRSGAIVNVSSIAGKVTLGGVLSSAYTGSKFALEAASETLAQEVRRFNIRVVIIEPGVIKTPIFEKGGEKRDNTSPYYQLGLRGERLFGSRLESATPVERVAETIQLALEIEQAKLRYLVGEDAERWAAGRRKIADELLVESGRKMDLDEYAAFHYEHFGMEI